MAFSIVFSVHCLLFPVLPSAHCSKSFLFHHSCSFPNTLCIYELIVVVTTCTRWNMLNTAKLPAWLGEGLMKFHPQLRSYWQLMIKNQLLGKGELVLFRDIALERWYYCHLYTDHTNYTQINGFLKSWRGSDKGNKREIREQRMR